MSVHGEFSRALEHVIACLRAIDGERGERARQRFEDARVDRQPDLSQAARAAREALAALDELGSESPRLAESAAHLQAHCRMVLGSED